MSLMKKAPFSKVKGLSLIELLSALTIGFILIEGIFSISIYMINNTFFSMRTSQMSYDVQRVMELISGDLRRAGYWANVKSDIGGSSNNNPFMTGTTNISPSLSSAQSCILLTYDRNADNSLNMNGANASTNEHFGYRLNNGAIQGLTSDQYDYSCSAPSNSTYWQNITDSNAFVVTSLTFQNSVDPNGNSFPKTVTLAGGKTLQIRNVTLTIQARLSNNSNVTVNLSTSIKPRADFFS